MTAEIAILNRHAVALAADSAATRMTGGDSIKVNKSANKIFSLSKYAPVGIMIYSRADYRGIPWEVVIKQYRRKLGSKTFDTVDEYAKDFLTFLINDNMIINNADTEDEKLYLIIINAIKNINAKIKRAVGNEAKNSGKISQERINEIIKDAYNNHFETTSQSTPIPIRRALKYDAFKRRYKKVLTRCYEDHVHIHKDIMANIRGKFIKSIYDLVTSDMFPSGYSGIVITGFGDSDIYPSLKSYHIGDSFLGHIQFCDKKNMTISRNCSAYIVPFAQIDIISMFMNGVHSKITEDNVILMYFVLKEFAKEICDNVIKSKSTRTVIKKYTDKRICKIVEEYAQFLLNSQVDFSRPVVDVVSHLQPQELSRLCETLVGLTSLKREMSWDYETVAGPVDVAVITKGDGLVWIKRKHYFDAEINHHFFANYFRGERDESIEE